MVNDAGTLTAVVLPAQALQLTAIPDYPLRGVWPGPSGEQAHTRIIGAQVRLLPAWSRRRSYSAGL